MLKCFLCGKRVKIPAFPYNICFWREKGRLYQFEFEDDESVYAVMTVLCQSDFRAAEKNPLVTDQLIQARIKAIRSGKHED